MPKHSALRSRNHCCENVYLENLFPYETPFFRNTLTQGFIWLQGYKVAGLQGYRVTRLSL